MLVRDGAEMIDDLMSAQLADQITEIHNRIDSIDSLLRLVVANSILDELDKSTDKCTLKIDKFVETEINSLLDEYRSELITIELGEIEEFHGLLLLNIHVSEKIRADSIKRVHKGIVDIRDRGNESFIPYFVLRICKGVR